METDKEKIIQQIVDQVEKLPPMPETVTQLREAVNDPDVNFKSLVPLIEKDPGLSADLLRFANSAAYGVKHHVETVSEAVLYYGMANLVEFIAISFSNKVVHDIFKELENLDEYFTHSQHVSRGCYVLAQVADISQHDQEVYKLAGLLHNIGRLAIMLVTHQYSNDLTRPPASTGEAMNLKEKQLYGINHCEVGKMICRKWEFPESIQNGIFRHHNPVDHDDINKMGAFICLSEFLILDSIPQEMLNGILPEEVLTELNLNLDKLATARKLYKQAA